MRNIQVTADKRYLAYDDGAPFFYLADTAWELFHRLTREEIGEYLSNRAAKGFTAIQAVLLSEFEGLTVPNRYGRIPLRERNGSYDPTAPDLTGPDSYWELVDYTLTLAEEQNLFMVLLPTWGDKFNLKWGKGPEIFTPENAFAYGKWLGERYCDCTNIIWMLGGDRPLETDLHRQIIDQMAMGIKASGDRHLMTFHPWGGASSVDFVADKDYIDFHTLQSGHGTDTGYHSWEMIRTTLGREHKPCLNSEPRYEDHPACFKTEYGVLWDAVDVRNDLYWDLLEGAAGHTYGNHCIWSMNTAIESYYPFHWREAMDHPGAAMIRHGKILRESRPYFELHAAPELVEDDGGVLGHIAAARGERYAFVYSPMGCPFHFYADKLEADTLKICWFNPRNGEIIDPRIIPGRFASKIVPPSMGRGQDWLLIADVL